MYVNVGIHLILIDDENILWVIHMPMDSVKLMVISMLHYAVFFHSLSLWRFGNLQVNQERSEQTSNMLRI